MEKTVIVREKFKIEDQNFIRKALLINLLIYGKRLKSFMKNKESLETNNLNPESYMNNFERDHDISWYFDKSKNITKKMILLALFKKYLLMIIKAIVFLNLNVVMQILMGVFATMYLSNSSILSSTAIEFLNPISFAFFMDNSIN